MKKVLFFPSFGGRGFGHINRCLALASEFSRQSWQTAFVFAGPNTTKVENLGYQIFRPHFLRYSSRQSSAPPAYTFIKDGSGQVLRDGLTHPWRIWLAVSEVIGFVKRFRPDVLIGDSSLLTRIVGQRVHLPVVQIVQSIVHPQKPGIIWWQDPLPNPSPLDIRLAFNPLLQHWNLSPIQQPADLLMGDLYLVPGIPATDPLPDRLTNTHYIGALVFDAATEARLPAPWDNPQGRPILYVTLGGSAGSRLTHSMFKTICSIFADAPWWVVMSLGGSFQPKDLAGAPPNLFCYPWLPGWAAIQRSVAILFHGGHSTMMEMVSAGIPAVVIPSHSEQEGNGRRLAALSAAIVISPAENQKDLRLVRSRWGYGEFTTWVVPEYNLDPERLKEAAFRLLKDPCYQQGAANLMSIAARYGGAPAAVDLTNTIIR